MALSKVQEVAVALVSLAMVWVLKGSWPGCGLLVLAAVLRSGLTTGDSQVDAWLARRRRWDLERTARRAVGGPRGTGIERFRAACDAAAARGEPSPDYAAFMTSLSAEERQEWAESANAEADEELAEWERRDATRARALDVMETAARFRSSPLLAQSDAADDYMSGLEGN